MPIALACSRGSGNMVTIMPKMTADVMAPPTPWAKRAAISMPWLCATPHSSDATVKSARPSMNTRLRPTRSPSRPASSSSPPKLIRYAFTTQARLDCEKPRSSWIDGRATFTTVASRTIISIPTHRTTSAVQREAVGTAAVELVMSQGRRPPADLIGARADDLRGAQPSQGHAYRLQGLQRVRRPGRRGGARVLRRHARARDERRQRPPHAAPRRRSPDARLPQARPRAGDVHDPQLPGRRHRRGRRRAHRARRAVRALRRLRAGREGHHARRRPVHRLVHRPGRQRPLGAAGAVTTPGVTVDDVRAFVAQLPRSYEVLVRDRVKFRVGQIVYVAFSRDETLMGFAFSKEEREALVA